MRREGSLEGGEERGEEGESIHLHLLTQNLSPKDIARSDIMKLKASCCQIATWLMGETSTCKASTVQLRHDEHN